MEFAKVLLVAVVLTGTKSFTVFGLPDVIGNVGAVPGFTDPLAGGTSAFQGLVQTFKVVSGPTGTQFNSQASQFSVAGPSDVVSQLIASPGGLPGLPGLPPTGINDLNLPNSGLAPNPQLASPVNPGSQLPIQTNVPAMTSANDLVETVQGH